MLLRPTSEIYGVVACAFVREDQQIWPAGDVNNFCEPAKYFQIDQQATVKNEEWVGKQAVCWCVKVKAYQDLYASTSNEKKKRDFYYFSVLTKGLKKEKENIKNIRIVWFCKFGSRMLLNCVFSQKSKCSCWNVKVESSTLTLTSKFNIARYLKHSGSSGNKPFICTADGLCFFHTYTIQPLSVKMVLQYLQI